MSVAIKICGLSTPETVDAAIEAVDAGLEVGRANGASYLQLAKALARRGTALHECRLVDGVVVAQPAVPVAARARCGLLAGADEAEATRVAIGARRLAHHHQRSGLRSAGG